jgi:hypothetical protein
MGAVYAYQNRQRAVPRMSGLGTVYMQPSRRSPNILRQTMMSGLGRTGRFFMGLGDVVNPQDSDNQSLDYIEGELNSGAIAPLPGQSVADPNAPIVNDPSWMSQTVDLPGTYLDSTFMAKKGSLMALGTLSLVSGLVSAYHGYRRDRGSLGSAVGWFVLGSAFPVITPAAAFLMKPGFAKPRGSRK